MNKVARTGSPGFTLIEMVTSLLIVSILLAACGSIMWMASQAIGASATRNQTQLQAASAAAQMVDDLNVATDFTEHTATAATFTVPDRLNTGSSQTVRYAWSGIAGDPLTRQFNGGTVSTLLPSVKTLNLTFATRTATPVTAPALAETLLDSYATQSGTLQNNPISNTKYVSQYFMPNVSLLGTYSITRVRLYLKAGAQSDALNVSIQSPGLLNKPSGTVLGQSTTVYQSALSSAYEWIDVPITGVTGISGLSGVCIVLKAESGSTNAGNWQSDKVLLSLDLSDYFATSTNSGSTWTTPVNTNTGYFQVYGTTP